MEKLYEKSRLGFALAWIGIYCVLQSLANPLNEAIGVDYSASAVFCILQTVAIMIFLRRNRLGTEYGLCRPNAPAQKFLFYVPLVIICTANLWNGVGMPYTPTAAAFRIVTMLFVGFLEEMIFRGFLFRALLPNGTMSAICISSVTFGLGHVLNLVNGSGASVLETVCQIGGAIAIGFLFVVIFWRSGSLLPCIAAHSCINTLNTFVNEADMTAEWQILHSVIVAAVAVAYALYLNKAFRPRTRQTLSAS